MDNKKIRQESQNEIKMAEMELEKKNMDSHMLRYEAIQLAKKCYGGKYISNL